MKNNADSELNLAYIGLGGNLGNPLQTLKIAAEKIAEYAGAQESRCSSFYRTAPVDSSGPDYVNAVMRIRTTLDPENLLAVLQKVENELGRIRPAGIHNAPRTMDCDLLLYGDRILNTKDLIVPHPRMHQRAFVLVPLLELDSEILIPGVGKAGECLKKIQDQPIRRID
jgi:2-amino-4-hydroxy-6-hydroxymethyldihydropteridine diphosphokinase